MSHAQSKLFESVGRAILAWARVEAQLGVLFLDFCGEGHARASQLWDRMRSFDGKMQSIGDIAKAVITDTTEMRDWAILQAQTKKLYDLRNKIAHSTMLQAKEDPYISPFFSVTNMTNERLFSSDIDAITNNFAEIKDALQWFTFARANKRTQHPQIPTQEPDLMRRLRIESDRKREAQRHRDLAVRQYIDQNPDLKSILFPK